MQFFTLLMLWCLSLIGSFVTYVTHKGVMLRCRPSFKRCVHDKPLTYTVAFSEVFVMEMYSPLTSESTLQRILLALQISI